MPDAEGPVDNGRPVKEVDALAGVTRLALVDLPFAVDASMQVSDSPRLYAAAAGGLGWRRAQLFAVGADGVTTDLIGDISAPARIGTAPEPLGSSGPHLIDRQSALLVQMHNGNMHLNNADHTQLLAGQNIAAIGGEIMQFGSATPIGDNRYILSHLLRGLGGTEQEMDGHLADEDFVLLDGVDLTEIEARHYAPFQPIMISVMGRGDDVPVSRSIDEPGRALKPWSPVHPRFAFQPNGDLEIRWTRRSRAGLMWQDHVEIPLAEETERYRVLIGDQIWSEPAVPVAIISATDVQTYRGLGASSLSVAIRQIGQHHISAPLLFEMEI